MQSANKRNNTMSTINTKFFCILFTFVLVTFVMAVLVVICFIFFSLLFRKELKKCSKFTRLRFASKLKKKKVPKPAFQSDERRVSFHFDADFVTNNARSLYSLTFVCCKQASNSISSSSSNKVNIDEYRCLTRTRWTIKMLTISIFFFHYFCEMSNCFYNEYTYCICLCYSSLCVLSASDIINDFYFLRTKK